jgi:hypothetical protein
MNNMKFEVLTALQTSWTWYRGRGARKGAASHPQTPQNQNLKNTHLVDMMSKVLGDLPFSRNQPLKSADD